MFWILRYEKKFFFVKKSVNIFIWSSHSVAIIVARLWNGLSWPGQGIYLTSKTPRLAVGPTQPPIYWIAETFFLGVKWIGVRLTITIL
jgi:hypothetical protein